MKLKKNNLKIKNFDFNFKSNKMIMSLIIVIKGLDKVRKGHILQTLCWKGSRWWRPGWDEENLCDSASTFMAYFGQFFLIHVLPLELTALAVK